MEVISRIYNNHVQAKQVVHDLETAGFPHSDITIICHKFAEEDTTICDGIASGSGIGAFVGGLFGLLAGLGYIAVPPLESVQSVSWQFSALTGLIGGIALGAVAGSIISSFRSSGISKDDARFYAEVLRRGGTIVHIHLPKKDKIRAQKIMNTYESRNIGQLRDYFQEQGYPAFNQSQSEKSPPLRKRKSFYRPTRLDKSHR